MIYSDSFIDWLISLEGFVPYVYDDATGKPAVNGVYKGYPTFGVGHLITDKKSSLFKYTPANPASKQYVHDLLRDDIKEYADCVAKYVKVKLKPYQYDALVSLCYNIGTSNNPDKPGFPQSQVCASINKGILSGTVLQGNFNSWVKSKGVKNLTLVDRRAIEYKLFTTGIYTTYNKKSFEPVKK